MMKQSPRILQTVFLLSALALPAACGGDPAPAHTRTVPPAPATPNSQIDPNEDIQAPIPEEAVRRARSVAAQFKANLKAALMEGLADGPVQAIGACSVQAPELAARLSSQGVRIGRTSRNLRNPANAPEPWIVPLLDQYEGTAPGAGPKAVRVDDATIGYVEPLYVGKPCLTCHGPAIPADVREEIGKIYPEDRAVGMAEGSFRGLVWVTIRQE